MSNEKMREEFDEWFQSSFNFETTSMRFAMREVMFEAWQASRAALCVEFPSKTYSHYLELDVMIARHVESSLDAAGVRYK